MKAMLIAAASVAALAPTAFAQTNVTIYGIADAGVSADRNGAAGAATAVRVNSGYMSTSRLGLTGTEDLGMGLKAVFTLELGYGVDTGAFTTYRGNPGGATASAQGTAGTPGSTNAQGTLISAGFNRRSFVGLQSNFGTISLGRDYTTYYWAKIATDTLGFGLYGNLQNITAANFTGTGSEIFHRASNAVFYTSPNWAGLTLRAMASAGSESFGGQASPTAVPVPERANQLLGIGANYAAGPLLVAAAIQEARLPATVTTGTGSTAATAFTGGTNDRRDWTVGAKYNFGVFSLGGGYSVVNPAGAAEVSQAWFGGTVRAGAGTVLAQWNRITQDFANTATARGRGDTFSVAYTYPFSRRTTGYATYGYVRNSATSAVALNASDSQVTPASAGANPRGFAVGVRHTF